MSTICRRQVWQKVPQMQAINKVLVYIIFLSLYKSTCFELISAPEALYLGSLFI